MHHLVLLKYTFFKDNDILFEKNFFVYLYLPLELEGIFEI